MSRRPIRNSPHSPQVEGSPSPGQRTSRDFCDLVRQDGYSNPNESTTLKTPRLSRGAKGEMGTGQGREEDGLTVPIPARNYLLTAYGHFARIVRETSPAQFIGAGWRTSLTKNIDNAVVAFAGRTTSDSCSRHQNWERAPIVLKGLYFTVSR